MRVCFDTLCFGSSQRTAVDDEPRAIVNTGGGALTINYKSVFPYQHYGRGSRAPRKQRAQGISAEPQTNSSLQDLAHQTFPIYDKSET
ncbi:unnamed protein product [Euphydryas editha]|uniref:Uncharacterized protein n=1 Tax=Euphydryas editha TaxID=104508 RepID=A0AAU9U528_EUPED|nr:unnamed protein product [Euphydryas editha]